MRRHDLLALALAGALLTACTKQPAPTPAAPVSAPNPAGAESKAMLNDKAFAAIQQKDWATAISLAGQVVEQDPNYAPARFNLGLALYRTGKLTEALPHLEKAYELNKGQVEPGWFFALTLEQTNQADRAVAVLQELAQRFPGDKEVHQKLSALSPTPVVWRLAPGISQPIFLGARVVAAESANTVAAFDAAGAPLWRLAGAGTIAKFETDDTGKLLAVVRDKSLDLVDATTGKLLGTEPIRWVDYNGKGGPWTEWHGDLLYIGIDEWMSNRYSSTRWQIYRTTDRGLQQLAVVAPAMQGIQVSLDGRTAIIQQSGGQRDLYYNGAKTSPAVTGAGALDPRGTRLYAVSPDGWLLLLGFEAEKQYYGVKPLPGYTLWNPWPRRDGPWFVASRPVDGGWVAYQGAEIAFQGEGGVTGYYGNYLVIKKGDWSEVVDQGGKVVLRAAGYGLRLTPDQQWAYVQANDQLQVYRIP